MRVRRTAGAAMAATVVMLGLAACGTGPEPAPTGPVATESASPSASPGTSPSSTAPEPVASPPAPDLSEVSPETAAALAVYFVQLYPYVYATGDLTAWTELSHPECVFCASVVSGVEEMHGAGHRTAGGSVTVLNEPTVLEVADDYWYLIQFRAEQVPGRRIDALSQPVGTTSAIDEYEMAVAVTHENGFWSIREVTPSETEE